MLSRTLSKLLQVRWNGPKVMWRKLLRGSIALGQGRCFIHALYLPFCQYAYARLGPFECPSGHRWLPINDVENVHLFSHTRYKIREDNGDAEYILHCSESKHLMSKRQFFLPDLRNLAEVKDDLIKSCTAFNELLHRNCTIIRKSLADSLGRERDGKANKKAIFAGGQSCTRCPEPPQ